MMFVGLELAFGKCGGEDIGSGGRDGSEPAGAVVSPPKTAARIGGTANARAAERHKAGHAAVGHGWRRSGRDAAHTPRLARRPPGSCEDRTPAAEDGQQRGSSGSPASRYHPRAIASGIHQ